jgi:hypothetical protein
MIRKFAISLFLALAGCAPHYALVPASAVSVAQRSMIVHPGIAWNKAPKSGDDVAWEENWTQNGPLLDSIGFIGGLPDGQAILRQRRKADRKVPVFHAGMAPPELASMIESYYRIRAGAVLFETRAMQPATFLGHAGMQLDFDYVGQDEVKRRGRMRIAVIGGKLYALALEGAALYYFDAALPEFESMARSATLG